MKFSLKYIGLPAVFLFATAMYAQTEQQDELDLEEMVTTFKGYDENLQLYLFSSNNEHGGKILEDKYEFTFKSKTQESKYDLKSDQFKGKSFTLTYTVEVATRLDEEGEEEFYEIYTIYTIDIYN